MRIAAHCPHATQGDPVILNLFANVLAPQTQPRPVPVQVPAEPIELVAIDLDGTLLRSDKQVSPATLDAIRRTVEAGVHVVLATARPPRSTRAIHESLGLVTPTVHYNGALISDLPGNRHVYHRPLPATLARQLVNAAREVDSRIVVSLEVLDRWYTDYVDPNLQTETSKSFQPDVVGPLQTLLNNAVTKLMFMAEPARLRPIRELIDRRFAGQVGLPASDAHLLQLVHPIADKAHALEQIATQLGVSAQRVMAIGDAPNDLGMLRWAGLGVAMQNAWGEVIATADVTVPSNDEDGVAFALNRYVLKRA